MNLNTIKSIRELTDKIKNERTEDFKLNRNTSKLFPQTPHTILSPANKYTFNLCIVQFLTTFFFLL